MPWQELRLSTDPQHAEGVEDALLDIGALAVTYTDAGDQPILEPDVGTTPLWQDIVLVALFDEKTDTDATGSAIQHALSELSNGPCEKSALQWSRLEDKVWEREWLEHHEPAKFGEAFWVYHETVDDKLPTLLLDPGLAFGTGSHPTTALCLDWVATQDVAHQSLLDYGCGSGILALAALLRGATAATCIDLDPQALDATRQNGLRNGIPPHALEVFLPENAPVKTYPIVVANILAGPLVELAPTLAHATASGGKLCLSGILADQGPSIIEAYTPWFSHLDIEERDTWLCVHGIRNATPAVIENRTTPSSESTA